MCCHQRRSVSTANLSGADAFVDNLTPGTVLAACLEENARRLGGFDRRLLAPRLAPRLARLALGIHAGYRLVAGAVTRKHTAGGAAVGAGGRR